jgi:hypothetical protein
MIPQHLYTASSDMTNGNCVFEAGCRNYMLVTATLLLTNFVSMQLHHKTFLIHVPLLDFQRDLYVRILLHRWQVALPRIDISFLWIRGAFSDERNNHFRTFRNNIPSWEGLHASVLQFTDCTAARGLQTQCLVLAQQRDWNVSSVAFSSGCHKASCSLPCSQQPATALHSEPSGSSPHTHNLSVCWPFVLAH